MLGTNSQTLSAIHLPREFQGQGLALSKGCETGKISGPFVPSDTVCKCLDYMQSSLRRHLPPLVITCHTMTGIIDI